MGPLKTASKLLMGLEDRSANHPRVGVCCDAFQKQGNCLTASGSSCASYGPAGETPLTAYCCDQLDIPACKPVSKASDCKVRCGFCCCGWFKAGACCLSVKQVPRALVAMTAPRLDLCLLHRMPNKQCLCTDD